MSESLRRLIGTVIMTGIPGTELAPSTRETLERIAPSGVILFRRNVENLTQLRRLIAQLHDLPSHPLVSIDHEGGSVMRLGPPFTQFGPAACVGRAGTSDLAFAVGSAMGAELASIGIDIDFAPVLDVHSNPRNPIIGERAFATAPADVARLAVAFQRGLHAGGLLACGKHFPGHGDTDCDSHKELPIVRRSRGELEACELAPFRAAIAASMPMLMTAHVLYPALDEAHPATLSRTILEDLLRRQLDFRGVVVSDDLEMHAVSSHHRVEDAALAALRAGVDWLLICNDLDLSSGVAASLAQAVTDGALAIETLQHAGARIRGLVVPARSSDPITLPADAHLALQEQLARFAVA